MGQGLIAQWRRTMAARGFIGGVMLAVPVAVATTMGFGGGFGALTEGIATLAGGPGEQGATDVIAPAELLELTAAELAESGGEEESVGGAPPGVPEGEEVPGGVGIEPEPGEPGAPGGGPGPSPPGEPGSPGLPTVPDPTGGGGNDLLDGLNETVNGLLEGGS